MQIVNKGEAINKAEEFNTRLQKQYIKAKLATYGYYSTFVNLSDELKMKCIEKIKEKEYLDPIINEVMVTTLLYPNDKFLMITGGTSLINRDRIKEIINVDDTLLSSKSKEFQLFNFSDLVRSGTLDDNMISQGSINGDPIYQDYFKRTNSNDKNKFR